MHPPEPVQTQHSTLLVDDGGGIGNDLAVRRVVTGHDAGGKAIVVTDDTAPKTAFGVQIWSTDRAPADNNDDTDGGLRKLAITPTNAAAGGHVLRVMRLPPHSHSPLHRTDTLDYGIVLEGRLDMELDDGVLVPLRAGDVVVQRGTIHAWINPHDEACRIAFLVCAALPRLVEGKALVATDR